MKEDGVNSQGLEHVVSQNSLANVTAPSNEDEIYACDILLDCRSIQEDSSIWTFNTSCHEDAGPCIQPLYPAPHDHIKTSPD
mmetsp:Transcript_252/g.316  ORF Transcript_252/g.316 Transcript_252/m.316 type:complete len:82 (-) Transcript_252:626-871(-)